jgi:hypothetical protein
VLRTPLLLVVTEVRWCPPQAQAWLSSPPRRQMRVLWMQAGVWRHRGSRAAQVLVLVLQQRQATRSFSRSSLAC